MAAAPFGGAHRGGRGRSAPAARSFEALYRGGYQRLTRLAHVMVGSNEAAEEIVQDAFVALYRRFGTVADPEGYLYRSVVNACKGRYRRKRVIQRLAGMRLDGDLGMPDIDETRAALLKLSPRRRAAVALRYYDDLSVDTIAELLDCRPATVRSLLHRALADLKELIDR